MIMTAAALGAVFEAGENVLTLVDGLQAAEFERSRMTRHEVRRQLLSIANALGILDEEARRRMPEIDWPAWAVIAAALRLQPADIDATAWFCASALLPATLMWLQVYRRAEPSLFGYGA